MRTLLGPTAVGWPGIWGFGRIEGYPLSADISSPYGPRTPILTLAGWTSDFHTGIDLPAPKGTPVCAPADCTVVASYKDGAGGQTLVVRFEDQTGAMFIHMEGLQLGEGTTVRRGDFIGFVGTSGLSTGDHLHYSRMRQVLDGPAWYARELFMDPLSAEGAFTLALTPPENPAPAPVLDEFQRGRKEMFDAWVRETEAHLEYVRSLRDAWGVAA